MPPSKLHDIHGAQVGNADGGVLRICSINSEVEGSATQIADAPCCSNTGFEYPNYQRAVRAIVIGVTSPPDRRLFINQSGIGYHPDIGETVALLPFTRKIWRELRMFNPGDTCCQFRTKTV